MKYQSFTNNFVVVKLRFLNDAVNLTTSWNYTQQKVAWVQVGFHKQQENLFVYEIIPWGTKCVVSWCMCDENIIQYPWIDLGWCLMIA